MSENRSTIELEVVVVGSTEEVWRAIATGPGISSWYVPHSVEERAGGVATASFGPGPEMQVPGRVAVWDPPHRIVFDGGEGVGGMTFEWTIEPRDSGTCVVRLVNAGFGTGAEWDGQHDAMTGGWKLFMFNLKLHLEHFGGQTATTSLPMAVWPNSPESSVWQRLTNALGISANPGLGDRISANAADAPALSGTVVDAGANRLALLLDAPATGTAIIAAEGMGETTAISIWMYLYGAGGQAAAERDEPLWTSWLASRS